MAYIDASQSLNVQAVEEEPLLDCVRHGCIRNVAEVANTVRRLVRRLEARVAPRKVEGVYVSIGGRSLMSSVREIDRNLAGDVEVTQELINQLKKEAMATTLSEKDVLAVVPREWIVDKAGTEQPVGMMAREIRMSANIISARSLLKRNLELMLLDKVGLKINGIIVRQLAEGKFVLTPEERRLGCLFVDFGAETTTLSIYKHDRLQYLVTLPLGSRNITLDITHLNHLEEKAEELKKAGGNALMTPSANASIDHDDIDFAEINNYVAWRAGEIIANIKEQLKVGGFTSSELPGGVIIVGKGAKLNGFNARLSEALNLKVRSGSVMAGALRILDNNIVPSDHIDILSILYTASKAAPVECLSELVVVAPPEPVLTEIETPQEEVEVKPKRSRWKFITDLGRKIGDHLKEPDEDDSDFEDDN